jgi:hypothetical protein
MPHDRHCAIRNVHAPSISLLHHLALASLTSCKAYIYFPDKHDDTQWTQLTVCEMISPFIGLSISSLGDCGYVHALLER